jgi:replicative DNA helicase
MGKTALMMAMADEMSVERNKRGAIFSLEMSDDELITRLISRRIGVDTRRLDRGELTDLEWPKYYEASGKISQTPLFIDDRPGASIAQIRAQAMRQQMETGLDYIMVDYLGLVTVPGTHGRYEQVSESARFFKNLAKELDVPVIVACQLNRGLESRADKRPMMSDLRDSGEIEEAANVILGLYRDDHYNPDTSERPNIGEIIGLKARNAPTFTVDLFWHGQYVTYRNLTTRNITF